MLDGPGKSTSENNDSRDGEIPYPRFLGTGISEQ